FAIVSTLPEATPGERAAQSALSHVAPHTARRPPGARIRRRSRRPAAPAADAVFMPMCDHRGHDKKT
ncbi:hypothetical protein AB4084_12595, partial [Lysobacter sp. 2RAB21]